MANTTNADWDEGSPAIADPRKNGALEMRVLRGGIGDRIGKEHVDPAAAGVGGEHEAGSAKSYYQASSPTLRPDAVTALGTDDKGRTWFDSDNNAFSVWNGSAWVLVATPDPTIDSFENTTAGSSMTQSSLTNGTWMVWIMGLLPASKGNDDAYTASVTVNSVAKTFSITNHPDGSAPFTIPTLVTVSAGTITAGTLSNIESLQRMTGILVAPA